MTTQLEPDCQRLFCQRERLVRQIAATLDRPMLFLSFVWLGLLIVDLVHGLGPFLSMVGDVIWGLFIVHFTLEFFIAPSRWTYLRRHWITALALLLPALRMLRLVRALRVLRATRAVRSVGLLRVLTSFNRGMVASRRLLATRGVGYVSLLTALVTFAGAGGIFYFENPQALREAGYADAVGQGMPGYGTALWWTAMMMTTMGTDYYPKTPEGRLLCVLLAVYAFAIFGYITAVIASVFIGQKKRTPRTEPSDRVQEELVALRQQLALLTARQQDGRRGMTVHSGRG